MIPGPHFHVAPGGRPLRIVVLRGGQSAEREVSLESGQAVAVALRKAGHRVTELDPAEVDLRAYPWPRIDACFVALHGPWGEDGQVQEILEELGVRYTGSGPAACRLAMSKSAAKAVFEEQGIPTPLSVTVEQTESTETRQTAAAKIGYPLVVKPDAQGSTIGVTIVREPGQLTAAFELAFKYDSMAVVESYIAGREITVAVLGGETLPVIEIVTPGGFYDYQAKYTDPQTEYRFEIPIKQQTYAEIERIAAEVYRALGCRGVARVDIRLDEQERPWVLELNTIPGMTDHSLVPKAAARAGVDFVALCDRLVKDAVAAAVVEHQD